MAFGGTPAFLAAGARTGQSRHLISELTGVTLAANVGAIDPTGAAADTGALTSNTGAIDAVPANHSSLPAAFGKGPDDWTQADVDAVTIVLEDGSAGVTKLQTAKALVANVGAAPAGSMISNANMQLLVHNLGAGAAGAIKLRAIMEHTIIR